MDPLDQGLPILLYFHIFCSMFPIRFLCVLYFPYVPLCFLYFPLCFLYFPIFSWMGQAHNGPCVPGSASARSARVHPAPSRDRQALPRRLSAEPPGALLRLEAKGRPWPVAGRRLRPGGRGRRGRGRGGGTKGRRLPTAQGAANKYPGVAPDKKWCSLSVKKENGFLGFSLRMVFPLGFHFGCSL